MRAMVLQRTRAPLALVDVPDPTPTASDVVLRVRACAVCRTDLHIVDGELPAPLPRVPGHQIVGDVVAVGSDILTLTVGTRVGVSWLSSTCGACRFCASERENLCDDARFTGLHVDGGFADLAMVPASACIGVDPAADPIAIAPLLCGGLIGYRALTMTGPAERVGIYGFGAAAHLVAQLCRLQGRRVFAFTRETDQAAQRFAREMGAEWAGASSEMPPVALDAAIIFAPVGALVPAALRATEKGGVVVCGGIHMSDIPSLPYELLWGERVLRSVANLTRRDAREFFEIVRRTPLRTEVTPYALTEANRALDDLRDGRFSGAAVLVP